MTEPMRFASDILDQLRAVEEVRIETRAAPEAPAHRTVMWVVVDDRNRVLIRTHQGPTSRWYREALAQPDCVLWLGSDALAVRIEPAADSDRVASASRGYQAKYAGDPAVREMMADAVLPTTLEVRPR